MCRPANRVTFGGRMMSIAIVLLGWVAASILLSPLIGRFVSVQDESEGRAEPHQIPSSVVASPRLRHGSNAIVRRNVAVQLSRRDAGWPRLG